MDVGKSRKGLFSHFSLLCFRKQITHSALFIIHFVVNLASLHVGWLCMMRDGGSTEARRGLGDEIEAGNESSVLVAVIIGTVRKFCSGLSATSFCRIAGKESLTRISEKLELLFVAPTKLS